MLIYNDCYRSVRVYYKEKVTYEGIPAFRFQTRDDFIQNIGSEYGNSCFCVDRISNVPGRPNGCLYKGALDLTTCQGKIKEIYSGSFTNIVLFLKIHIPLCVLESIEKSKKVI